MIHSKCPAKEAVEGITQAAALLGQKWTLLILSQLCSTEKGFNQLQRELGSINPRILSLRLKLLALHGIVVKTVLPTSPPQVEYRLTPKGEALRSILHALGHWAKQYQEI